MAPKHGRRYRRIGLISLVLVVLVAAGGAAYVYHLTHDLKRVEVRGLSKTATKGRLAGPRTS